MTTVKSLSTVQLREMLEVLKVDAKALYKAGNKEEGMKLFRLLKTMVYELHRRQNPTLFHEWN